MTPATVANSFTDTAGREWPLRLTLGILPRLKSLGVDVGFAVDSVPAVVEAAFRDPETAGRVLWTLVELLAGQRGVTPEQLVEAIDGPALAGAVDAFAGAVVAFTHRPTVAPAVMETLRATQTKNEGIYRAALSMLSASAGEPPATPAVATPAT